MVLGGSSIVWPQAVHYWPPSERDTEAFANSEIKRCYRAENAENRPRFIRAVLRLNDTEDIQEETSRSAKVPDEHLNQCY